MLVLLLCRSENRPVFLVDNRRTDVIFDSNRKSPKLGERTVERGPTYGCRDGSLGENAVLTSFRQDGKVESISR